MTIITVIIVFTRPEHSRVPAPFPCFSPRAMVWLTALLDTIFLLSRLCACSLWLKRGSLGYTLGTMAWFFRLANCSPFGQRDFSNRTARDPPYDCLQWPAIGFLAGSAASFCIWNDDTLRCSFFYFRTTDMGFLRISPHRKPPPDHLRATLAES